MCCLLIVSLRFPFSPFIIECVLFVRVSFVVCCSSLCVGCVLFVLVVCCLLFVDGCWLLFVGCSLLGVFLLVVVCVMLLVI